MIRFVHCADLHLDSPLRGLDQYEGAPVEEMREATRRAFENVVELAIDQKANFVLVAGDVFDGDLQDFRSALYFANQLRRLADEGIRVFIVAGNHDAASRISRHVPLPDEVHVFDSTQPETVTIEELGVAVHGQSFATAAVKDDIGFAYPAAVPGVFNIGLLHTALTGREGHQPYAPTTVDRLNSKGYQYWALGHVHTHELVQDAPCWVVFPGNIQGRHARETGEKGCVLVEIEDGQAELRFVATDVARWVRLEIDASELESMDELGVRVQRAVSEEQSRAGDRVLAVRLDIRGRTSMHAALAARPEDLRADVCAWLNQSSGGLAWLEKLSINVTGPLDLEALARRDDPIGLLVRRFHELEQDPAALAGLVSASIEQLAVKLPPELRNHGEGSILEFGSEAFRVQALANARERLLAAISGEESE